MRRFSFPLLRKPCTKQAVSQNVQLREAKTKPKNDVRKKREERSEKIQTPKNKAQ